MMTNSPGLLISVRSLNEARIAQQSGADLIDLKEPLEGSLGRVGASVLNEIATENWNVPLSAALGELCEWTPMEIPDNFRYLKWGLSKLRNQDWRARLENQSVDASRVVAVAYADAERASSPAVLDVLRWACDRSAGAFLIDTYGKDRGNLMSHLSIEELKSAQSQCREHDLSLALAGSLSESEIEALMEAEIVPQWFAVRGAVCEGANRTGRLSPEKIKRLRQLLSSDG